MTGPAGPKALGRRAVRASVMHATIHLVTHRDCVRLHHRVRPVLERDGYGNEKPAGLDVDAVLAVGRTLMEWRPRTPS